MKGIRLRSLELTRQTTVQRKGWNESEYSWKRFADLLWFVRGLLGFISFYTDLCSFTWKHTFVNVPVFQPPAILTKLTHQHLKPKNLYCNHIYTHLYIIVSFSITSSIIHFQIQGTCNIMGNINRHTAPCAIAGPQEAPNKYREQSFGEPYAEPDGAKGRSWTFRLVCGLWLCVRTEHLEIDRDWHDQDRWIEGMNMKSRVPSGHANQETQEQGADVFLTAVWSPSGSMFVEGCHVPQCQCTESVFKL